LLGLGLGIGTRGAAAAGCKHARAHHRGNTRSPESRHRHSSTGVETMRPTVTRYTSDRHSAGPSAAARSAEPIR
jgi:hypothetical protein